MSDAGLTVACVNVNGIRAFARRGGMQWLTALNPDVTLLQEVRATHQQLLDVLTEYGMSDQSVSHAESDMAGRAGVAIVSRAPHSKVKTSVGPREFKNSGRWVQAEISTEVGPVTLASTYVHKGDAGGEKMATKLRYMEAMRKNMVSLRSAGSEVLVGGDFNIAHSELDIKNWKGNIGHPGFIDEERAHLDNWFGRSGWVDLCRRATGDQPGPYTWWSWRGKAFDNDAGWRIDYQIASEGLAQRMKDIYVARAASYAQRASDHAPVVATFI